MHDFVLGAGQQLEQTQVPTKSNDQCPLNLIWNSGIAVIHICQVVLVVGLQVWSFKVVDEKICSSVIASATTRMADLQNGVLVICHLAPGSRFNSNILVRENQHTYQKNNLDAGGFRCSKSKNGSPARLLALEDGTYFMTTGHDGHDNKEDHLKNPEVPIAYDANLERAMQRARRSAQPPVPQTIDEADASLIASELYNKTADGTSNFYHGRISTPAGTALGFISVVMLPLLRTSEEIACDGTFATLPLLFSQLFTLHVSAYRYDYLLFFLHIFLLAYAVMSEKTKSLYQLILDRILHVLRTVPGEGVGIIRMVSD
ncbi:hypothetical protein OUZ56_029821 [Daphnia magna]|uniref:Uncharacterized protein n=1 Tax=Daphnia magna TaxID=35525 RepID=A0ABR0B7X9_9CRUS|nr:hypothetical protein OUZ56_029821 [Daphnia magna]